MKNLPALSDDFDINKTPWNNRWTGSRQPTIYNNPEEYRCHAYTAAEVALQRLKDIFLPICPDLKIEISFLIEGDDKPIKKMVRLDVVTIDDIGPNLLKALARVSEKLNEDQKRSLDITNIGDYGRFRVIVPTESNGMKAYQIMDLLRRRVHQLVSNDTIINDAKLSDCKDQTIHPSDEGWCDLKTHMVVTAPQQFRVINNIPMPRDIAAIYAEAFNKASGAKPDNGCERYLDNHFFVDKLMAFEVQFIPEYMLIAEKLTDKIRDIERRADIHRRNNNFWIRAINKYLQEDYSSLPDVMSILRSNINNIVSADGSSHALVPEHYKERTKLRRVTLDISSLAVKHIQAMLDSDKFTDKEKDLILRARNYHQTPEFLESIITPSGKKSGAPSRGYR